MKRPSSTPTQMLPCRSSSNELTCCPGTRMEERTPLRTKSRLLRVATQTVPSLLAMTEAVPVDPGPVEDEKVVTGRYRKLSMPPDVAAQTTPSSPSYRSNAVSLDNQSARPKW